MSDTDKFTTMVENSRATAKLGLVAFDSLGDGLLYLMIAENLRLNGYDVTSYGNIAYQMRHWLPDMKIKPYPDPQQFEAELEQYDLVIVSPPQFFRNRMDEQLTRKAREKWLLICQKCPPTWSFDHTERLSRTLDRETFAQIEGLANCSGSIRYRQFTDESAVEMTLQYMLEKMHLPHVRKNVPLSPPRDLVHRRCPRRIIISPDSAGPENKNWTSRSFIRLAHELQARGYSPEIVVAPKHHASWVDMKGNAFPTPCFQDIDHLSSHLYESGAVIANDSGNGHLASFLGVPVVTIYRKRNPLFHWRPDWGPGIVVCPRLTIPWVNGAIWKPFVPMSQVIAAVEDLCSEVPS